MHRLTHLEPSKHLQSILLSTALAGLVGGAGAVHAQLQGSNNQVFSQADLSVVVAEDGDEFGMALASGDFNGDGFDDLAVGAPGEGIGAWDLVGAVQIIHGTATGLDASTAQTWDQEDLGLGLANEFGDNFGGSLAAGLLNGDNYADLAIGISGEDLGDGENEGAVVVLYGSADGLTATGAQLWLQSDLGGTNEEGDSFGWELAICDFDDNGTEDLAIASPGESPDGGFDVVYGFITGLDSIGSQHWEPAVVSMNTELLGMQIACADFDGDDNADLAAISFAGDTLVMFGTDASGLATANHQILGLPSRGIGYDLEVSLTAGDITGDGRSELVIEDTNGALGGGAWLFPGTSTGLDPFSIDHWSQDDSSLSNDEGGDNYGTALAVADFDLDGFGDLVLGGPGEELVANPIDNEGAVLVFRGTAYGPTSTGEQIWHQQNLGRNAEADDRFGRRVTTGDFNGDGAPDLVVGIPDEDVGTVVDAGAVLVLFSETPPIFRDGFESGDLTAWSP